MAEASENTAPKRRIKWLEKYVGYPLFMLAAILAPIYIIQLKLDDVTPVQHESAAPWHILIDGYHALQHNQETAELTSLSQQEEVTLYGYIYPLESAEEHSHFLLVSHSASCPFHQLIGQGNVVEVKASTPIEYTHSPILVSGRFSIAQQAGADIQYTLYETTLVTP